MITPSHVIYNVAAATGLSKFLKRKPNMIAVAIGGFLPDIPAFIFFFVQGILLQTPHQQMWDVLYFNSAWTPWITISHSFILWPLIAVIAFWLKRDIIAWIATSALMHAIVDFFVHSADAYKNFWPFSNWRFVSPVSYWNPVEYGNLVGTIDAFFVLILLVYLYKKFKTKIIRIVVVITGLIYLLFAVSQFLRILN